MPYTYRAYAYREEEITKAEQRSCPSRKEPDCPSFAVNFNTSSHNLLTVFKATLYFKPPVMRVEFVVTVIRAAGLSAVLAAPLYRDIQISNPHGDVRSDPSYVSAHDHRTDDERHFHLLVRVDRDNNTSVDDPAVEINYKGDDGTVPFNPAYADTGSDEPITIPSSTEQPGAGSQPAASNDEQTETRPSDKEEKDPETTKNPGTGVAAGGALAGVIAGGAGVAGGAVSGGGRAVGGIAAGGDAGGNIPSGDSSTPSKEQLGTDGDKELPKQADTTVSKDAPGADGTGGSLTFEGDVSNLPPAEEPTVAYFDEDGNEVAGPWTSEEGTISGEVSGNGEGALSESGRPGPSRGPGGPAQKSPPIRLEEYRESDKSIAADYVATGTSNKVKPFAGGRTEAEKKLFESINSKYTDLKEVDATSDVSGSYASRNRGSDRYM